EAHFSSTDIIGSLGTLHLTDSGAWTYDLDNTNPTVQALGKGSTATDTIIVHSADGTSHQVTITVNGTNDAAVIMGTSTGDVHEGHTFTALDGSMTGGSVDDRSPDHMHGNIGKLWNDEIHTDGHLSIVDADTGESYAQTGVYYGSHGRIILQTNGDWTYYASIGQDATGRTIDHLGKSETLTDTVTVKSADGTTHDIVITIHGDNDRPYCSSKVQLNSGKEDLAQTITATELLANTIDVDSNDLGKLTVANLHADHGSILDNQDGTYTFTPTKDYNGQVHFSYDVTDAHGGTTHTGASTTLTATPDSAIISEVTTDHVTEDGSHSSHNAGVTTDLANGRLQVVDPDSGENKFQYSQFGESAVHDPFGGMLRIDSMGNWGYSVNNANLQHLAQGQTETVIYRVHSYDGTAYELHIHVVGTNDAPTVTQVALSNGTEDTHYQMQASQFGFTDVDTGDTLHSIAITDIPPATQGKFVLDGHDITAGQHIPTADISKLQFVPAQNFNGDVQFKYTVNDGHTDSTEATNTLHFDAVGDVAVITGTTTGDVDEGHGSFGNMSPDYAQPGMAKLGQSALTADGKLDIVDPDTGESQFDSKGGAWNNSYHGQYGHLLLNTDGTWHYDVTVGNVDWVGNRKTTVGTTIDELGENQTLTDTITIYSKDGTAHDIVITIHGDNDRPYISSEVTLATGTEDTAQTLTTADLLTNTVDVDANDVGKLSIENLVSDHGSLLDNKDGTFTFTPEKDYNGTVHFSYDVKDAHGGVTHTGATTTLVAVQDNAIISGVDTGSVTENTAGKDMSPDHAQPGMSHLTGAMLYADGKLSISDPDAGENEFDTNQVGSQGYTYHGSYGQLILNADGSWHYNVNAGSQNNGVMPGTVGTAIDKLGDGESLTDTITIRAKDGTTHDIVITIHGSNDRPYCSSEVQLHSGKEDTAQTLTTADLLANTVDVDANDASQLSIANLVSDHGVVIDNKDGTFTFNPDKDYNGQVHFTYDVKDTHGGMTHTGATTTLAAVNDAALFSVDDTGSVKEDVHVQGDSQHTVAVSGVLIVSDPDAGESEFVANRNVHAVSDPFGGDLSIGRAGDWTYSVSNNNLNRLAEGEKHKVTYEVVSRGGDKHQIVITVVGTNDDPILSVTQTTPTTGTLTETDVDVKDTHTFSVVSSTGQFGSISVDPDSGAYVYTANSSVAGMAYNKATHTYHGTDVFEVKVADNHGGESSMFITFDTNGHISVVPGQQPTISTTVPVNPLITTTQPSLPTGTNTPPSNAVTLDLAASSDTGISDTDNVTKETTPTITGHTDIPYSQVTVYDGSTLVGHAVSDASGQYSVTVNSLSDGDHNLSAKALAPSSVLPAASSLLSVHIDTQVHVGIQTDPITADNVINAQESNSSVDVTGSVSGDFNVGDIVTLNVNGAQHTGAVDSQGHYSIAVPGSELTADADQKIEASIAVTDSAGNSAHATTDVVYQVDTQVSLPTITFENAGSDNLYSKTEIAHGHPNTITATITPPGDAKIGEHLVVNGQDHVLNAHSLQHGLQIEVRPGSQVQATMTDEHGNTAGSQGFSASAIPEPIVVKPPSGSHQVSATLGAPPLLPSLTPVPTTQHGWRIHLPNGQYVTSHHGQYGTLTINPQTGDLHYQEQANVHTGPHGSASGIGQHEDKFEVALQGTNQDEVVAHVNIQILSHGPGNSGKLNIGTEVVDMTITPIAHASHPAPPPQVQHDQPDFSNEHISELSFSVDLDEHLSGASAYLDALGITPEPKNTEHNDHHTPTDLDIVLAHDNTDITDDHSSHIDLSDAMEHHNQDHNHNKQEDENHHHHNDIDGLPDIDPNT
ncbi:VCBS domain-containing protein, partial [Aliivibrio sifiae]